MKITAIIQARMGSTRLPGKCMRKINGKTLLEHILERTAPSVTVDQFIVATTTKKQDDFIVQECENYGISCFRGSENDVLDRYYQCAKSAKSDIIVRITSDCPLHHYEVIDFCVNKFLKEKVDFMSNAFAPKFEDGFDVEVFTFELLEYAWKNAASESDREHVTPFMRKSHFKKYFEKYHADYDYKLSVDSIKDFLLVEQIFKKLSAKPLFKMGNVIELLKHEPHLLKINEKSIINEAIINE